MVYSLFTLLKKTTLIDMSKTLPPKVINRKNFTKAAIQVKKAIQGRAFTFQMIFYFYLNIGN